MSSALPKTPPPNTITLVIRFLTYVFGEDTFRPQQHASGFHSLISSFAHSVREQFFTSTCRVPGPMLVTKAQVQTR